jgi:hypothetical protein
MFLLIVRVFFNLSRQSDHVVTILIIFKKKKEVLIIFGWHESISLSYIYVSLL